MRLLEKVTNGTVIEISVTGTLTDPFVMLSIMLKFDFFHLGTAILLKPGIISGGVLTHECPTSRSVGYFLEPVIQLAPFAKQPVQLTLKGVTTDENDLSVRTFVFKV